MSAFLHRAFAAVMPSSFLPAPLRQATEVLFSGSAVTAPLPPSSLSLTQEEHE